MRIVHLLAVVTLPTMFVILAPTHVKVCAIVNLHMRKQKRLQVAAYKMEVRLIHLISNPIKRTTRAKDSIHVHIYMYFAPVNIFLI